MLGLCLLDESIVVDFYLEQLHPADSLMRVFGKHSRNNTLDCGGDIARKG